MPERSAMRAPKPAGSPSARPVGTATVSPGSIVTSGTHGVEVGGEIAKGAGVGVTGQLGRGVEELDGW